MRYPLLTLQVPKNNSGDLYAGHDGNVYKKSDSRTWQDDAAAHTSGAQRPNTFSRRRGTSDRPSGRFGGRRD